MRLTLRTLLAYRDRVLSDDDHASLHGRIQKSDFASNLLRRIDSVAHKDGIGSPPVLGTGLGSDANTVSEYLDDSLQSAHVPEMERICLLSDAQLSELADCHELLTTALTTQIDVPKSLREQALKMTDAEEIQRVRKIAGSRTSNRIVKAAVLERVDAAHDPAGHHLPASEDSDSPTPTELNVQVPMVASAGTSIRPEGLDLETASLPSEVPEYLRGNQRGRWLVPSAIAGLCGLLLLLVWQTLGPWDEISKLFTAGAPSEDQPTAPVDDPTPKPDRAEPASTALDENNDSNVPTPPMTSVNADGVNANSAGESDSRGDDADKPSTDGKLSPDSAANPLASDSPSTDTPQTVDAGLLTWQPLDAEQAEAPVLVRDANAQVTLATPESPIGSGNEILLPSQLWTTFSMPTDGPDSPPKFAMRGPLLAQIIDDGAATQLQLDFGRGLVATPEGKPAKVALRTKDRTFQLSLAQDCRLTVERNTRRFGLGTLDDAKAYRNVTVFLALENSAVIGFGEATPVALEPGDGVAFVDRDQPRIFKISQVSLWLRDESRNQAERLAAEDLTFILGSQVAQGKSVADATQQATQSRRPETRAAAAHAALLMKDFKPAVAVLSDPRCSAHWKETISLLRELIAAGALDAEEISNAIGARIQDTNPGDLRKLLVGSPAADYPDTAISFLIAQLESRSLLARVLAIDSLENLTGSRGSYLPARPTKAAISQWKKSQATGRLKINAANDPLYERKTTR